MMGEISEERLNDIDIQINNILEYSLNKDIKNIENQMEAEAKTTEDKVDFLEIEIKTIKNRLRLIKDINEILTDKRFYEGYL